MNLFIEIGQVYGCFAGLGLVQVQTWVQEWALRLVALVRSPACKKWNSFNVPNDGALTFNKEGVHFTIKVGEVGKCLVAAATQKEQH